MHRPGPLKATAGLEGLLKESVLLVGRQFAWGNRPASMVSLALIFDSFRSEKCVEKSKKRRGAGARSSLGRANRQLKASIRPSMPAHTIAVARGGHVPHIMVYWIAA